MGFVSLGKQVPEVRFKLCRGGNGDDADAEAVCLCNGSFKESGITYGIYPRP